MKKGKIKGFLVISFVFTFSLFFVGNVDAASFKAYLDCPTSANTNETITCDISISSDTDTKIESVKFSNLSNVKVVSKSIDSDVIDGVSAPTSIGTVKLKVGTGSGDVTIKATVKPEAAGLQSSSVSKTIDVVSSVNTLKSLKVDGVLVRGFASDISSYSVETKNKKINISAAATSSVAKVTGAGSKELSCGNNSFKIKVKAESGSVKTYTLSVKRKCSAKVYLSDISLSDGTLSPEFNKEVTKYEVKVGKDVKTITITGTKGEENQTVSGNVKDKELKIGSNEIKLTVTDDEGEKTVYTINVIRGSDKNSNTYLSALTISSGNITFDKNTFEYETKVLYSVRNIEVIATPEKSTSKYVVTGGEGLVVGENIVKVTVTSQSGDTRDYIIKVTRLKEGESFGNNANVKSINIQGYDLKFQYNKTSYKLVIKNEDSLNINVVMDDINSTYRILGNSDLKDNSVIEIITTSTDGTSKTYYINIVKKSSVPYIIISIVLIGLAMGIVTVAYFKLVRKKKVLLDVNGNRMDAQDDNNYRRVMMVPQNDLTRNAAAMNNLNSSINGFNQNMNNGQVMNSGQQMMPNQMMGGQQMMNNGQPNMNPMGQQGMTGANTCPNCGRELLGTPEVCPYCSTRLR